jgi:hypothetical protein
MNQTAITIVVRFAAVPLCLHAGARFRMLVEEMTQRHEQFLRMLDTTGVEHPADQRCPLWVKSQHVHCETLCPLAQ